MTTMTHSGITLKALRILLLTSGQTRLRATKFSRFMKFPKINFSPALRTSIGLIALILGWITLIDLLVGIWPDENAMLRELRQRTSESLTIQSALLLQAGDGAMLKKTLEGAAQRDPNIQSLAIQQRQGKVVMQVGNHGLYWKPISETQSTLDFVRVDLKANNQVWGELQIAYLPSSPQTVWEWLKQRKVLSFLLLIIGGLILYTFYLRRIFVYLDPSSVIPDRVSSAFDNFSEGVMMVDRTGRIMLANKTLRSWVEDKDNTLFGKSSIDLYWLKSALREDAKNYPWMRAMDMQEAINGWQLEFQKVDGEMIKTVLNCSPIQDVAKNVRGCLITFDNLNEIDRINKELRFTMDKLNESQAEIENQNIELRNLAARDPLTSCLNRRAFFETADKIYSTHVAKKRQLTCIMTDIDHFKSFNDKHGHAVGDKVLVAFTKTLFAGLRNEDLLCRYGGEEFCILLPDATPEVARSIAERLRAAVESHAGSSIRSTKDLKITASFGVAFAGDGTTSLASMIDQADQALYTAKTSGRNCVKSWQDVKTEGVKTADVKAPEVKAKPPLIKA
jgi:diguanylate cyclase (GGDEF)-like protein